MDQSNGSDNHQKDIGNERPSVICATSGPEIPELPYKLSSFLLQGAGVSVSPASTWIHQELKSTSKTPTQQHYSDYCCYGEQMISMSASFSHDNKTLTRPDCYSSSFGRDDMIVHVSYGDVNAKDNEYNQNVTGHGHFGSQETEIENRDWGQNKDKQYRIEKAVMSSLWSHFPNQISLENHTIRNNPPIKWGRNYSINFDRSSSRFLPEEFHQDESKQRETSYVKQDGISQCHDGMTHTTCKISRRQGMAKDLLGRTETAGADMFTSSGIDKQYFNDVTCQNMPYFLASSTVDYGPMQRHSSGTVSDEKQVKLYSSPPHFPFQIKLNQSQKVFNTKKSSSAICSICNKVFKRSHYLKSHMLIHSGTKPYKCRFCVKRFSQVGNRNAHERLHAGSLPHCCEVCDKRFNFISALHIHMKTHRRAQRPRSVIY